MENKNIKHPKHVVILSLDAVGETDIEYLRTLPNFKKFYKNAAYCDSVKSVYPSLTYPAHSSIITGKLPCNHGVVNNVLLQPERKVPDWRWQRHYINGTTLYDAAKKVGHTVGAFLWPVTGKSKSIDYHIPEIFPNRKWDNQIFTSLRNGSKLFQLKMFLKFKNKLNGIHQPELDNFTFSSAMYAIRRYKPNLVLVHLTDVDTYKHYGNEEERKKALKRLDRRLYATIKTLQSAGIYDESTLVILGDHSQYDADYIVYLNTLFKNMGWLQYDEKTKTIKNWKVLSADCDGSAYVYIKPEYRKKMLEEVYNYLKHLQKTDKYGIDKIYTGKQAVLKGAGRCDFMVEARKGYYFQNEADIEVYKLDKEIDRAKLMIATHGYDPEKPKYGTIFAMAGVGVKPGKFNGKMSLIDEAPTIAKLMGLPFPEVDGRVMKEFLQNG